MKLKSFFSIIFFCILIFIATNFVSAENVILPSASPSVENEGAPGWLIDQMDKGGPVMYPIFLCSVLGLAIIFERSFKLSEKRVFPKIFISQMRVSLKKRDIPRVIALCETHNSPLARIIRMGLLKYKEGLTEVERAIETAASLEVAILSERLRMLSTLANTAPLLGFLGTVTGMIKAFNVIASTGSGRPDLIGSGISEALITTAAGLFVGIPLTLAYFFFQSKVDSIIIRMEELSISLLEELRR